jgi:hypothetical protein
MSLANLKPWKAGQSGNPSGRSKDVVELMRLARKKCTKAINVCVEILEDQSVPAVVRLDAAKILLERGMGKPPQPIALEESPQASIDEAARRILDGDYTEAELVALEEKAKLLARNEASTNGTD